jgi:hypothetical protein
MTRLLFTNLGMLVGLGALAVPILIHLLLKRRTRRLRFSTLQFFQKQDEQSSQRRKLRNLLLLAVRLLLLTLLVLAFARPYLPGSQAAGARQQRRLAVFVIDRSASMQAADAGSPRWPRAREAAQKILADLTPDDRAALISCSSHAEVLSGAAPAEVVTRLLKDLQPASGLGSLGDGLQLAKKVVYAAGSHLVPTIYVVSDLQRNTCGNLAACPLPPTLEVRPVPSGDVLAPNLAVAALQLDNRETDRPHALLANYASDETKTVRLKVALDEKELFTRTIPLSTGAVTRFDLALPSLSPGWHSGALSLQSGDSLALDDVRYAAFFVPQPVRTLVVETRASRRVFEEESFFVTSALDPTLGTTNAGSSRFVMDKVSPAELVQKLSSRAEPPTHDLVILPGLREVPAGLARALAGFVEAGGGLLLFLGPDVSASRYNDEFRELLPARLGHSERNTAESFDLKWHLEECDLGSPMFSVFRRPNSGNLALPEFTGRFSLATNQDASVTATFADGVPIVAGKTLGRGRVVLVNTSADTAWTDWPKHKTYVPWLHSACFQLAARTASEPARGGVLLVAADALDIPLGVGARGQSFRVVRLGGKEITVTAGQDGSLRGVDGSLPGIYSVRDRAGQELQRLAVNPPAEESDLAGLTPAEFQRQLVRTEEPPPATLAAGLLGLQDPQNELWRFLLLAVLGLLFGEVLLANRTHA